MKMISRRDFLKASAVVGATGVLTACGGSSASTAASSTAASTAASSTAAAASGSANVGVCIYQFADNFMTLYRTDLEEYLKDMGYAVTIVDGKNDQNTQTEQINTFLQQGVDVLIINPVQTTSAQTIVDTIKPSETPIVFINREPDKSVLDSYADKCCYVGADARQSGTYQGELILETETQGARFRQKLGTCVIFARLDLLQSTLRSALPTPGAALMLIEQDEQIILCCDADGNTLSLLPESFCSDMADGLQHSLTLNKTTYLTDSLLLSSMGWRLVSLVPEDEIAADLMPLLWLGMLICVVFAICIGVWNLHIQRSIMAPVKQLTAFIENDLDDKLQNRIHISTSSEMELFCQEINTLLDKVSEMTAERLQDQTRLYELNLAKKRAELSALQSQINPHFLYNTLDCIRGYGYMLNSSEIVSITNALSSIMRYCIKGADIVALRKEMTIVNYYLDIIRIRFPNRFNYVFDVDPALEDLAIPRFIIQPVVENAIYHGLESRLEKGTLTISCHTTEKIGRASCRERV